MNKKIYITLILFIMTIFTFFMNSACYADNENIEKITKDLKLSSSASANNETMYGCYIETNDEIETLSINATEFNLPSNLYDYRENILLRVTYTEEDYKVYDCKVINNKTGEIIEDLTEENLNKLFNPEYGKDITEKTWSDKIQLSDLKENMIYKYTANSTTQFPEIENNTGKNCIIYIKEKNDQNYDQEINLCKKISSPSIEATYNEYNSGDTFCIMYKSLQNSELLDLIGKDEIIYLSKYKDGDKLEYQFEKYIYNDTNENITINTKDKVLGEKKSNSVVIPKGEIYEFDWMIDSATISYSKVSDKDKEDKTDEKNNDDDSKKTESSKEDDTITKSPELPQTGISNTIIAILLITTTIMIITAIKSKKLKDIK